MASIKQINGTFYVRFGFRGITKRFSLGTSNFDDARNEQNKVIDTIHQIKVGRLPIPDDCPDPHYFIFTGGRQIAKTIQINLTLQDIWEGYEQSVPLGSRPSLLTEKIHYRHFIRVLKNKNIKAITFGDLQEYINKRLAEKGNRGRTISARTVRKEIATFTTIWNNYALPSKMVPSSFGLTFISKFKYGKESSKAKFQTWDQIENQITNGNLTKSEANFLWDGLFLDLDQISEILDYVKNKKDHRKWLYPMFLFAAHTGARRSEILRSQIQDWDFEKKVVVIREKKRNKEKEFTFRDVYLSDQLVEVMRGWVSNNKQNHLVFSENNKPLSKSTVAHVFSKKCFFKKSKWTVLRGWHIFRHSMASNMACKGIDPRQIDAILGHQTEEMRKRYQHMFPQSQKAAIEAIFRPDSNG